MKSNHVNLNALSRSPIVHRAFLNSSYVQRFSDSQARRILRSLRPLMVKKHHFFQEKLSEFNVKHILSPDVSQRGKVKIKGFHLDRNKKIENGGYFDVKTEQLRGQVHKSVYTLPETDISKESTHFPAHWSYKKAAKRILEVYHHPSSDIRPSTTRKDVYFVRGKTKGNVTIEVIYNNKSQKIETAYPIIEENKL